MLDFHTLLQACPREKDRAKILILQFISENGKASRKMVIQALRMRPSTVSNSIAEMIDDGLLSELSMRTNAHRGRPELFLSINPDRFWAISFSIMSMSLIITIANFAGEVVEERILPLDRHLSATQMTSILNGLITEHTATVPEGTHLLGYGIAFPGLIDKKANLWRMVSRFPNMKNLKFEGIIGFSEGKVLFERNIDAILNYRLLADPEARKETSLLLHWGYGIAISFAANGKLLQSGGGLFGEIGHWTVPGGDSDTQTIETLAAAPACMQEHEWSEDFDEASITQSGFISQEKLKDLYTIIAQVMRNLHLTFFPDTFYLLSPFVDAAITEHLSQGLSETLRPFAVKAPKVINLHYSSDSEAMGMVSSLFSQTLGPFLQARW
ncbi:MAG TPA: ROK family transcriptional regulator [Spirochaetales bacterium]|nr:ROK family transcriptional regulator [Spirochaetales bacterium]